MSRMTSIDSRLAGGLESVMRNMPWSSGAAGILGVAPQRNDIGHLGLQSLTH